MKQAQNQPTPQGFQTQHLGPVMRDTGGCCYTILHLYSPCSQSRRHGQKTLIPGTAVIPPPSGCCCRRCGAAQLRVTAGYRIPTSPSRFSTHIYGIPHTYTTPHYTTEDQYCNSVRMYGGFSALICVAFPDPARIRIDIYRVASVRCPPLASRSGWTRGRKTSEKTHNCTCRGGGGRSLFTAGRCWARGIT